jgi:cytochrome c
MSPGGALMISRFLLVAILGLALPATAFAAGDPAKGENAFKKCKACHTADEATNKVGPTLKGVVGRKAASVEGYSYSEPMKKKGEEGLTWDEANIDAYLSNPKQFIPGNKMAFVGVKKPDERADVIAYLKTKQ